MSSLKSTTLLLAVLTYRTVVTVVARTKRSTSHSRRGDQPCYPSLAAGDKLVYFIRHGEGVHNTGKWWVRDAPLTPNGITQAEQLVDNPLLAGVLSNDPDRRAQLLVISPARRTMQTALVAFGHLNPPIAKWELSKEIQESAAVNMDSICNWADPDEGAPVLIEANRTDLLEQYQSLPFGWEFHEGYLTPDWEHGVARFQTFTQDLLKHSEQRIMVVTHGDFLWVSLYLNLTNAGVASVTLKADGQWHRNPAC